MHHFFHFLRSLSFIENLYFLELTVALIRNHLHWLELWCIISITVVFGTGAAWLFPVHLFPSAVWGLAMSHPFVCAATDFWSHALFTWFDCWAQRESEHRQRTDRETGMEGDGMVGRGWEGNCCCRKIRTAWHPINAGRPPLEKLSHLRSVWNWIHLDVYKAKLWNGGYGWIQRFQV